MTSQTLSRLALLLALTGAVFYGSMTLSNAADEKAMDKEAVEKVVHDFIVNNPELILKSVDDFQRKTMQARQEEALSKHKDTLFTDTTSPEGGNPKGDVTMVEFFDYNCGYCKRAHAEVKALLEKDPNVRIIYKDFPILGPSSELASKWSLAAHQQGKFQAFYDAMMDNKKPVNEDLLAEIAKDIGLDVEKAKADAGSTEVMAQIEKNRSTATDLGISGTPGFVIGGEIVPGALPADELLKKVEEQRKK